MEDTVLLEGAISVKAALEAKRREIYEIINRYHKYYNFNVYIRWIL